MNRLRTWLSACVLVGACGSEAPTKAPSGDDDGPAAKSDAGGRVADAGKTDAKVSTKTDASRPVKVDDEGEPMACGKAELTTQRVVPRVWLLIDGSGSMSAPLAGLAGQSRFALLRQALLAPNDGLVAKLASSVAFGLMIYDGGMSPPGVYVPGVCPRVIVVEPALDNLAAITAAYPAQPTGASTPTHYALLDLQARIEAAKTDDPSFVLLATDGKPNLCDFHDGIPANAATDQQAVDTVTELAQAGTKTFALSMAGDDADLNAHLKDVARAGNTGSDVFTPTSQDGLADALTQIFGGTQSCDVKIEGTVVAGKECSGDVTLNGTPLTCNDANGYHVKDDKQTLELAGDACKALRQQPSSQLSASFACDDVIFL